MDLIHNPTVVQFLKYAIAGGIATVCHILFFHLVAWKVFPALQAGDHLVRLLHLPVREINDFQRARNSMISNFIAFIGSNLVAYLLNILWVFEAGRHHIVVEILLFYGVSAISMAIGTSVMGLLIKHLKMMTTYAFGANVIAAVLINYVVRKYFIFLG